MSSVRSTHTFNPFGQVDDPEHVSLNQLCETILEALSLNHGEGYGRSYFSRVARNWLQNALQKNEIKSFEDLYRLTLEQPDSKERGDAFELISVIESLASFEQLNFVPGRDARESAPIPIHMPEVLREREVVYFWLPAAVEAATVRELAKLALYSLLTAAYRHTREQGSAPRAYLVIDEFQRIASANFKIVLEQARSMGIGAILANQTPADLQTPDTDLRPTVQANTRLKLCFSASDLGQQDELIKASGETIDYRRPGAKA